jgi:hypothetical protein
MAVEAMVISSEGADMAKSTRRLAEFSHGE